MEKPFLGFWDKLPRPFFALAPLANVTDHAFRQFLIKYSKPHVLWTEFVAADGLCHPKGREALLRDLRFSENERPIVAQLFTGHPEKMFEAAKLIATLGFDGLDINMGCPDRSVMKQGAGADCMRDPKRAQAITQAALEGVAGKIPVSVKTRLGDTRDELEAWLPMLLETAPALVTIHARTRKEFSLVPARWDRVGRAVEIAQGTGTLIMGNGDVGSLAEARRKVAETGCAGVMLGRAVFGNPWLFDAAKTSASVRERLLAALNLTSIFTATWGNTKSFELLKKHFQAYVSGFPKAKELRTLLMETCEEVSVRTCIQNFLALHPDIAELSVSLPARLTTNSNAAEIESRPKI